jgi:hypothetical protein
MSEFINLFLTSSNTITIYGTGLDDNNNPIVRGNDDPHWYVIDANLDILPNPDITTFPHAKVVNTVVGYDTWVPNTQGSLWIGINADRSAGNDTKWNYYTTFYVNELDITGPDIEVTFSADDGLHDTISQIDLWLNGIFVKSVYSDFTTVQKFKLPLTSGFVQGKNILKVRVYNHVGPSGLKMEWKVPEPKFESQLGDLSGKAYIYNLRNLRNSFYVGNVFYRNGKIVVMTSGSNFEGLQLSNVVDTEYQYDVTFKSKQTIFEKQVVCPVEIGEFNVSTNPTAVVLSDAPFDVNDNGMFDFQDADVLLRYMAYKSTEFTGIPDTNWSSSIVDTTTDEEQTVYDMYYNQWEGTDQLFSSSYSAINNTLFSSLDFNEDNKINHNDMSILWKYFIYRLTQKNYETWITPSSRKKFLSDILDYLNQKTMRGYAPMIGQNFLDYSRLSRLDPTGSYLAPTVTSVGLYNGCDLVAVAKLGSPIKITPDFPINFVIKMDF